MIRLTLLGFLVLFLSSGSVTAQTCSVPNTLTNNTTADATQVMANFTAILSCVNALANQPIPPQGRLTLTSNTPVMTSDVTGASTVYYTPYIGALVPIYSASTSKFTLYPFTQLSAVLSGTTQTANNVYDLFIFLNSGTTVTIGFGPSWTTGTGGTNQQRGTGAGSTAISQINGIWTNSNVITLANSTSSYPSIPAGQATYVGTIATLPTTAGQTSMQFKPTPATGGTNTWMGVYNAYNRVQTVGTSRDSTNNWTYGTNTWRPADNNSNNRITYIDGLGQSLAQARYYVSVGASVANAEGMVGVDFDSISATPGGINPFFISNSGSLGIPAFGGDQLTALGLHYAQAVEDVTGGTVQYYGFPLNSPNQGLTLRLDM